uniref:Amino acid transporter transmembrane domain-containing protein n=1 Tax=Sarcophilus harrisii TaxID=9305 RepID=A0A7N4NPY4_SARHA
MGWGLGVGTWRGSLYSGGFGGGLGAVGLVGGRAGPPSLCPVYAGILIPGAPVFGDFGRGTRTPVGWGWRWWPWTVGVGPVRFPLGAGAPGGQVGFIPENRVRFLGAEGPGSGPPGLGRGPREGVSGGGLGGWLWGGVLGFPLVGVPGAPPLASGRLGGGIGVGRGGGLGLGGWVWDGSHLVFWFPRPVCRTLEGSPPPVWLTPAARGPTTVPARGTRPVDRVLPCPVHPGGWGFCGQSSLSSIPPLQPLVLDGKFSCPGRLVVLPALGLERGNIASGVGEERDAKGGGLDHRTPPSLTIPLCVSPSLPCTGYLGYTSGLSLTCWRLAHSKLSPGEGPGPRKSFGGGLENVGDNDNPWWLAPLFSPDTPSHPGLFVCHPEVLPIYTELRRPSQRRMQAVANMSIGAMFLMYGLTATFGYLTFFGHVEAEMLHMYSQDLLILCVRLAVLMAVTLTIPVVLFPIRRAIQQLLFPTKAFSWTRHGTIALVLLALVNVLVIFVPDIRDIFGVIGATSAPSLIFILPSIFYIRIIPREREALTSRPKLQATAFTALGVVIMAMSLGFIFTDWAVTGQSRGTGH